MGSVSLLLRAVRAPSLIAGAVPVAVVTALLVWQGAAVVAAPFLVTLIGLVALQAGVNVVNDLFDDASGLDADPDFARNPFPLGSRVLQRGELSRRGMWGLAGMCFGTGLLAGLWLDRLHPGHLVLGLGLIGFVFGVVYTAPPLQLAYRGLGEPVIFLLFGPLAGLGTAYVQTGRLNDPGVWLLSSAFGLIITTVLYLHHFPQYRADARHGKRTPVVRLTPSGAARLVPLLLGVPFLLIVAGVALGWLPWPALIGLGGVPLALRVVRTAREYANDPRRMTAAFQQTMGVLLATGGGLCGGLLLSAASA